MRMIRDISITQVAIVDDEPAVRDNWSRSVEDMDVEPLLQESLPGDVQTALAYLQTQAQAVVSDHHLRKISSYASFNGAEFVAACYDVGFPAVLCTGWLDADRDEIRPLRRKIPVAIPPKKLDPDVLQHGYEVFIDEMRGQFIAVREPHRTLLKVVDFKPEAGPPASVGVIVCGWDAETVVEVQLRWLPESVRREFLAGARKYLRAQVNIGSEHLHELYFDAWEPR